jgi:hypothetical protein
MIQRTSALRWIILIFNGRRGAFLARWGIGSRFAPALITLEQGLEKAYAWMYEEMAGRSSRKGHAGSTRAAG